MTVVFISPAEPAQVRGRLADELAKDEAGDHQLRNSGLTEARGVDFLWRSRGHWWGCQRKELKDLLASMVDGRLAKELGQMHEHITAPVVVIERRPKWTNDGVLLDDSWGTRLTYGGWIGLLMSLNYQGIGVVQTDTIGQTAAAVSAMVKWSSKPSHDTLLGRPGPVGNGWGTAGSRDWAVHMLQGIPGIGPGVAGAVFDHFGRVPMEWTCGVDELEAVAGVGKVRAKKMMGALT